MPVLGAFLGLICPHSSKPQGFNPWVACSASATASFLGEAHCRQFCALVGLGYAVIDKSLWSSVGAFTPQPVSGIS